MQRDKRKMMINWRVPLPIIQIKPEDIYVLRNGTGRPFTDHMDSLLRSAAAVVGIANEHISDNPRTNIRMVE